MPLLFLPWRIPKFRLKWRIVMTRGVSCQDTKYKRWHKQGIIKISSSCNQGKWKHGSVTAGTEVCSKAIISFPLAIKCFSFLHLIEVLYCLIQIHCFHIKFTVLMLFVLALFDCRLVLGKVEGYFFDLAWGRSCFQECSANSWLSTSHCSARVLFFSLWYWAFLSNTFDLVRLHHIIKLPHIFLLLTLHAAFYAWKNLSILVH